MYWTLLRSQPGAMRAELERLYNNANVVRLPVASIFMASAANILGEDLGFRRSAEVGAGRNGDDKPAPVLSYGLVEYLDGLDLSGLDALEIGGGDSSTFWSSRTRSLITLETDENWVEQLKARDGMGTVEFVPPDGLAARIAAFQQQFDIIVIDPAANRLACARAAIGKVRAGGFIILDNSEWYPNASRVLRDAGLIEVDFHDFRPAHHFRATTSLYLTAGFRPKPKKDRLPLTPVGGKDWPDNGWDADN